MATLRAALSLAAVLGAVDAFAAAAEPGPHSLRADHIDAERASGGEPDETLVVMGVSPSHRK